MDHLLLNCEVAGTLWNAFFCRFGVSWVMRSRVADIFSCWWTSGLEVLLYGRWYFLDFFGVFGGKEMNWSFEDHERTLAELESFFFFFFLSWDSCVCTSFGI